MEHTTVENKKHRVSITHMNNAHSEWLRALSFYKDEFKILQERLTEIAGKNTDAAVMKEVDHFENQFAIQAENINKLSHEIKANVSAAAEESHASSAGYIDGVLLTQHNELQSKFDIEEKIIKDLRQSFNRFASEWM